MSLNIEISGVYPANRGALLMLEAIRERVAEALPGARLAVPLDWQGRDRLRHSVWGTRGALPNGMGLRLLEHAPAGFRDRATYIRSADIDVLLDASGFGYGDFWGLDKLQHRLADRLQSWKTGSRRAVMLPQALGPFTDPGMADAFRRAAERLDRIYVRDARSLDYVRDVLPQGAPVERAPDFTNLLKPDLPGRLAHLKGASLVIPNEKMVANKGGEVFARYMDFLMSAVAAIRGSGRQATLLLHEGNADKKIAGALNDRLDDPLPIVNEDSALVTKAVVGAAELIVSSRFHGLVSALSSGVPALACGWSHKYRELMADYGCEDMVVDLDRGSDVAERLSHFLAEADNPDRRVAIAACAAAEREKSRLMWNGVFKLL